LVLRSLGQPATYRDDALVVLGVPSAEALAEIESVLDEHVRALALTYESNAQMRNWWAAFARDIEEWAGRGVGGLAPAHYERLRAIGSRAVAASARPVPGMTIHQAKGQEWNHVHLEVDDEDVRRLADGLAIERASDRALYVAVTRARVRCTTDQM
jgi:DNA helicase II / ATP-dependent DNA helicase PcrA